jgi:hypothetical protein
MVYQARQAVLLSYSSAIVHNDARYHGILVYTRPDCDAEAL